MELQLGLALSSNTIVKTKGFDLNCYGSCESKEVLGVGSCLTSESIGDYNYYSNKRGFDEVFEQGKIVLPPKTLSLLSWDKHHPNEEDDPTDLDDNSSTINKGDGGEDGVVGWPPIKSWRKRVCQWNNIHGGGGLGGGCGVGVRSNSTYVKVKMEGMGIARKVDLSLHHSYQGLKDTLVTMFGRDRENVEAYKLTYQDREGDWLLAGDVPWRYVHVFLFRTGCTKSKFNGDTRNTAYNFCVLSSCPCNV